MFGRNSWTDKLKEKLTDYIDEQFVDYRERLANDLARGVGALAVLVVKWSLLLLFIFFAAILLAFCSAELMRPFLGTWSYTAGFGLVLLILMIVLYWISRQLPSMENQVFEDIRTALLDEKNEVEELLAEEEPERLDDLNVDFEKNDDQNPGDILNIENPEMKAAPKGKDPFRD